jgi:hypothetical protein
MGSPSRRQIACIWTFLEISMPLFGEFNLVVNQNVDFWYEEAIEAQKYKCGHDQHLLDIREIGTSSVVNYANYADCWWRQASNIQAIDGAGDEWQVLHQLAISHPFQLMIS